jgi:hypothetical protein
MLAKTDAEATANATPEEDLEDNRDVQVTPLDPWT